jgi:hypothetical protein
MPLLMREFLIMFIVLAQPSMDSIPGQTAFHHPPTVQHLKSFRPCWTFNDLQFPRATGADPSQQVASIAKIAPHFIDKSHKRRIIDA